ncbi:hypothetical protein D3C81_1313650 [compost metagenome]
MQGQQAPQQQRQAAAQQGRADQFAAGVAGFVAAHLLAEGDRLHDQRQIAAGVDQRQEQRGQHHQGGAQGDPAGVQRVFLRRCGRCRGIGRFGEQRVGQDGRQRGEQQGLGQRFDHRQGQVEAGGAGAGDHGQADHHEGAEQRVAAAQGEAEAVEQAQGDQQQAAERRVLQQWDEQQAETGGEHHQQRQAERRLKWQRLAAHRQQVGGEQRGQEWQRHGQPVARCQRQGDAAGQAQGALWTGVAGGHLSRRTTASSSPAGTDAPAG